MSKLKKIAQNHSPSILAGFFIGTSYIPFPPWATLFCFVPLWRKWEQLKLEQNAAQKIFFSGWIAQFVLTLIGFNWVALTAHDFGYLPWPLAIATLLIFCSFSNLDIPIAGLFWFLLQKRLQLKRLPSLLLLAVITALMEIWVPTIFPWNYGYTWLWIDSPIAQTAEVFGFQGISSITIMANVLCLFIWESFATKRAAGSKLALSLLMKPTLALVALFVGLNSFGIYLKSRLPEPDRQIRASIIQANIGNLQKVQGEKGPAFREHITNRYFDLSRQAFQLDPNLDFLVWPETAYPYDINQASWSNTPTPYYPPTARKLMDFAAELGTNLLTGGYGYSPIDQKLTNTFFVVEKDASIQPNPYYKTILLAFGEFIPFAKYLPKALIDMIPAGDFSRGLGPQVVELKSPQIKIGPMICYESLFPNFSTQLANYGAEIIVNLTNDSWYGTWQEPYQHGYMTLGRAIEVRRPIIRSTNTGMSSVILANGDVLEKSPLAKEWFYNYTIPYKANPEATFYQKFPWLIQSLLLMTALFVILGKRFERNTKS